MIGPARWSAPVPCFALTVLLLEVILLRRAVFQAIEGQFLKSSHRCDQPKSCAFPALRAEGAISTRQRLKMGCALQNK
jgi:hypothetical protein